MLLLGLVVATTVGPAGGADRPPDVTFPRLEKDSPAPKADGTAGATRAFLTINHAKSAVFTLLYEALETYTQQQQAPQVCAAQFTRARGAASSYKKDQTPIASRREGALTSKASTDETKGGKTQAEQRVRPTAATRAGDTGPEGSGTFDPCSSALTSDLQAAWFPALCVFYNFHIIILFFYVYLLFIYLFMFFPQI